MVRAGAKDASGVYEEAYESFGLQSAYEGFSLLVEGKGDVWKWENGHQN